MAGDPDVAYADGGFALAGLGPVTIAVLTEAGTLPRLAVLRKFLEGQRAKWPGGTFAITILGADAQAQATAAEVRTESTAIARDFPSLGNTIVVEGTGFAAAATRAFLSGLFLVSRNRSKIHANVPAAAAWLAPLMERAGHPVTPGELARAAEKTRDAVVRS